MTTALIVVVAWTILAVLVGPIVGRCIRDGHGDETESQHPQQRTERRAS